MPEDDRALARAIATASFRGYGTIRHALDARIETGWPQDAGLLQPILITAVAQILFMDAADHAAVDLAVTLIHQDSRARRYSKLANAVLRRIARETPEILAEREASPRLDLPEWLTARWERTYGAAETDRIAESLRSLPAVDVTLNPIIAFDAAKLPHISLPQALSASPRRSGSRHFPAMKRARSSCRTPPRRCRHGCLAQRPASGFSISAPRPAAKRRSSRPWAQRWLR